MATSFLGSSLLFMVQPMVAKMLLPSLGGTPSVWNTSMVFFQTALVAGYGLAHLGRRLLAARRQRIAQVVALAAAAVALPVALPGGWDPPAEGSPTVWLLAALSVMVGLPFLMLSTASPTLQHWFATGRGTSGRDPYFLYAAGNAGSLLALLAYPVLIEPRLSSSGQARLFSAGYLALVVLSAACASRGAQPDSAVAHAETASDEAVRWDQRARWLAWSFVPSALLLGVTRHLTTDVMSVPMLWIAPLTLYLLTFILAFGRHPDRLVRIGARGLQVVAIPLTLPVLLGASRSLPAVVVLHLAGFFLAALLGHSRLAQSRPAASHLTEFYLVISIGGALGGAVTALVAPLVFPTVIEYPLAIVAALAMCPGLVGRVRDPGGLDTRVIGPVAVAAAVLALALAVSVTGPPEGLAMTVLLLGVAVLVARKASVAPKAFAAAVAVLSVLTVLPTADTLVTERSFFGVTRVRVDDQGRHQLMSGSTLHGVQDLDAVDPLRPLVYYFPEGPVGQHFRLSQRKGPREIAAVGLGSGALAGYGRAGDRFTFYEIDPAVARIAQDRRYFTYLSDTPARVDIVMGDGRLRLARSAATYDTLVLDAFSSDAIPVHLLTREAFTGYLDRLAPEGVIAVHITNRYFDLEPVLTRVATDLGLTGLVNRFDPTRQQRTDSSAEHTVWVMLARDPGALAELSARPGWHPLDPAEAGPAWTDSFSDILGVFDPR